MLGVQCLGVICEAVLVVNELQLAGAIDGAYELDGNEEHLHRAIQYFEAHIESLGPDKQGARADSEAQIAVIGTPDDLIQQIERLQQQSGGFGVFLDMAHNWADFEQTKRSYELIARYVMPHFQGRAGRQDEAYRWAMAKKPELVERRQAGIDRAIETHAAERQSRRGGSPGSSP